MIADHFQVDREWKGPILGRCEKYIVRQTSGKYGLKEYKTLVTLFPVTVKHSGHGCELLVLLRVYCFLICVGLSRPWRKVYRKHFGKSFDSGKIILIVCKCFQFGQRWNLAVWCRVRYRYYFFYTLMITVFERVENTVVKGETMW